MKESVYKRASDIKHILLALDAIGEEVGGERLKILQSCLLEIFPSLPKIILDRKAELLKEFKEL